MAADEGMAERLRNGEALPTLRLYGWSPPAVSLGYHQDIEDFDLPSLRSAGVDIVRRPTGGKAILHDRELTYCIVTALDERGPRALYRSVNACLLRGLRNLGIDAELSSAEPDFRALYRDPSSIPCFSSSARDEIQFRGKKLVGSAQRRFGRVILQHGSLLLGPQHLGLVRFLSPGIRELEGNMEEALAGHTTDAETILGREVTYDEAAEAIRRGFESTWNIKFEETAEIPVSEILR